MAVLMSEDPPVANAGVNAETVDKPPADVPQITSSADGNINPSPVVSRTQTTSDGSTASAAEQLVQNTNRLRMPVASPPKEPAFELSELADRLKSNKAGVGAAVFCLALVGFFTLRGCDDGRVPTYPVSGRVVFADGTPVRLGVVELESVEHGTTSQGTIRQDGTFVLGTHTSNDGAPAGTLAAIVVQIIINDGTVTHTIDHGRPVAPAYGNYRTSGLEVVIEAIEQNEIEIRLKEPKSDRGDK